MRNFLRAHGHGKKNTAAQSPANCAGWVQAAIGIANVSRWTMGLSNAVQDVFVTLYEQGLIYRGPRLVNWSPGLQTAVSDLEVEREEEAGKLYYLQLSD